MLLARFAPIGSHRYEWSSKKVKSLDKLIEWLPVELFAIWSIFVAGMASGKAQIDRFYFWDWSDWLIGVIGLIVITVVLYPLKKKMNISDIDKIDIAHRTKSSIYFTLFYVLIFIIGWVIVFPKYQNNIVQFIVSYVAFYSAILFLYTIILNNNYVEDIKLKNLRTSVALLLLLGCIFLGFTVDEPVIATAAIVSLPFLVILLFGKHVRHLERAKFYPIFAIAMFVTSREAWFLIPLLLLFFVLRSYNYLRFQTVAPTFGVTQDSDSD